ncbi:MAG TPA: GNAT family N-acetyltransferase [Dokdonella sp.]|nr:GNAT family N-acetyltransferase [Dokdonella sp.]
MDLKLHYRIANEADIDAMSAIRLDVRENRLSDPAWLTRQMWIDALQASGNANTWVCESGSRIVGFSSGRIREADIWALFVDREYEGRGIGKALLGLAVDWLQAAGVDEIRLGTGTQTRADAFYARQGWQRGELASNGDVIYRLRKAASPVREAEPSPTQAIENRQAEPCPTE